MRAYDQPQQYQRVEEPLDRRDDRRKQVTNPAHAPVPANPPVEQGEVERGRDKLERILN